jgi:brefeldin A-resistance guanine nucleotide exchange factor 1
VFEVLITLATSQPTAITADNYEATISLANDFASAGSIGSIQEKRRDFAAKRGHQTKPARNEDNIVVQRATKAISIIYTLTELVPSLIKQSHLERHEAWAAYWSPIFRALCSQCVNPCREVRHRALSALQRTLLSETTVSVGDSDGMKHPEWTAIFDEVLFPLTLRLLKPEIYQLDPQGMNDTRAQSASILCKIFLRYLERLVTVGRMGDVWVRVLELLDRLVNAGADGGEGLEEAVREGVKNVLLVMDGGGYLGRGSTGVGGEKGGKGVKVKRDGKQTEGEGDEEDDDDGEGEAHIDIWTETNHRLDRFLPGLMEELFPAPPEPPQQVAQVQQVQAPGTDVQAQAQAPILSAEKEGEKKGEAEAKPQSKDVTVGR